MNRIILGTVCILGLLQSFGLGVGNLVCDAAALLTLAGVGHYLIKGRLPENFWAALFGVLIGPFLVGALLHALYMKIINYLFDTFGRFTVPVIIMCFLAISSLSFLYILSRTKTLLKTSNRQNSIDERQPVLTLAGDNPEAPCEALDLLSDYADED